MRKRGKIDANQPEVVEWLRKAGATVQSLANIGNGCPDLLVGYHGKNYLMEIKDGDKVPSRRVLTPDEITWHMHWQGEVHIVERPEAALLLIGTTK